MLMAMAADNGFNFFLILSGTIDNLREQTRKRLINDLNSQHCGIIWDGLDSLGSKGVHLCIDNCNYNSNKDIHFRLAYLTKDDHLNYATGFLVQM